MMIHRRVRERLQTLAPYLTWDNDPYMVITPEGRLVWIVDGYTTSDTHPFSRSIDVYGGPSTTSATRSRPPSTPMTAKRIFTFSIPPIP